MKRKNIPNTEDAPKMRIAAAPQRQPCQQVGLHLLPCVCHALKDTDAKQNI
uniref:Uncharacterized protein n=1 Tax=Anguilla anguilla TaxID=7936 RepID=A0A0E9Q387_ANGAN